VTAQSIGLGKPNANTGVDLAETSVGIAFGGSNDSGYQPDG
jgi:hypothetical protein